VSVSLFVLAKALSNSPSRSLSTLTILLEEVPMLVRPFHPQLTRTMIKSVTDPSSISVRNRAAAGLGELMKHQVSTNVSLTGSVADTAPLSLVWTR
jgi:hypothetical protein